MQQTADGIKYPVSSDLFPSATWWAEHANSVQATVSGIRAYAKASRIVGAQVTAAGGVVLTMDDGSAITASGSVATNLSIGTVSAGPAAASMRGTWPNRILDLTIPPGAKGDKGDQGIPGPGLAIKGSVPTASALPASGALGDTYITLDDQHGWVWGGTQWIDLGPIRGPQGSQGDPGPAPNMSVSVSMLAPDATPIVTKTGTAAAPAFALGIPRGQTGAVGPTPTIGVAATGLSAGAAPTATRTGTDANPTITFGIPQGMPGATGATPNIAVTATTLAAGSSATVAKTGTSTNPTITFGIPQGVKGDPGEVTLAQLNTKLDAAAYTAADALAKIKSVDGTGSGLDADLLDGIESSGFVRTGVTTSGLGTVTSKAGWNLSNVFVRRAGNVVTLDFVVTPAGSVPVGEHVVAGADATLNALLPNTHRVGPWISLYADGQSGAVTWYKPNATFYLHHGYGQAGGVGVQISFTFITN